MRTLKLGIWIFVLYIIQNIFYPIMTVTGIVPDLLLGFAVSYSAIEPKLGKISRAVIICAVLCGTGTGRVFPITVLMTGITAIVSYLSRSYLRFIPQIIRTQAVAVLGMFLMCCFEYFVSAGTITAEFIQSTALWYTLYTVTASTVIYIILKKTMQDLTTRLLITDERS